MRGVTVALCGLLAACSSAVAPRGVAPPGGVAPPTAAPSTPSAAALPGMPCGTTTRPPAVYRHVVWIWMENHSFTSVIGNPHAPYLTQLTHDCATLSRYSTVGSPSLPNYLGATAGTTFGIGDDNGPRSHPIVADNLFRQVRAAGGSERSYEESMPAPCSLAGAGEYAVKHNPAAYYVGPGDRAACQADDVPLTQLADDLAGGYLPTFSFVTPNLCNDTHDCSVAAGDAWLRSWVPRLLAAPDYRAGTMAVVIVYDEYTPMPNVFIAPSVAPGTVASTRADHYALLRATEEMLGIPVLLGHAAAAPDLRALLQM